VWRDRRMGEEAMRITVVGVVIIVVAAIAALLLIRTLTENQNRGPKQNDSERPIQ